ncbi:MAG TPA: carboxypeptidase regulatory-like domain-containing protein, partial [Terriglobales bacterium]|nr:carboxypeptidase regulatory-like domain-containing protein [Terriglobales bacterium]
MSKQRDAMQFVAATLLALVFSTSPTLRGQTGYGSILGRVTDPSGAVVSGVSVTLRNEATNVASVMQTNADGEYVFPDVIPGVYEIVIRQEGFQLFDVSHIDLLVGQTVREDAQLTVGATTTKVSVIASAPLVQTDTSSVESVIDSKQISMMPLDGRTNIFPLIALAPGVQGGAWGFYTPKFGGNTVEGSYNVRIDGTDASESENEYIGIGDPSLDAIAEFKVIDSMGSAKYGTGAASVIMVTKSGTNEFHGSAFEYNRIKQFAAKNFFATGLPKSPYIRNEFGGSLGGPIKKNKLFFFGSYEGLTFRSSSTSQSAMPTTALLQGDFTGLPTIKDPSTGAPFPGNKIDPSRFSSASQFFLKYFDTPNLHSTAPGGLGTNFVVNLGTKQDEFRYEGRGDYTINDKNQLSVMWFDARYVPRVYPGWSPKFGGVTNPATYQNVAINYTSTIQPTLTNLATFGFHRIWDKVAAQTAGQVNMHTLFPQIPAPLPGLGGLPNVTILGFNGLYDTGGGGDNEQTWEWSDTLSWAKGKHLIEAGFSVMHWKFYNYGVDDNGSFTFTGRYTGNSFADFLLGDLSASNYAVLPVAATPTNDRYGFFVTDDWKPTPKLTLNMGLRYDLPTLYQNSPGNMSNFYPNLNALVILKGQGRPDLFPGVPILSGSSVGLNAGNYIGTDHKMIAPRLGLAWRPLGSSRLILRGGYGLYYVSIPWVWGSYQLVRNAPFTAELNYEPAAGSTPTLTFADPFPTGQGTNSAAVGPSANALPTHYRYPATHQWNFTIESEIARDSSARISYLGSESEHVTQQFNLNDPPPQPGPVQAHRPYQPFGPITLWSNGATANTQQLQLSARRRFAAGLSFQGEFSWTKMLDGGSYPAGSVPTDNRNIRLDRGNDSYVRQKYFVGNYVYEFPFGRGQRYLASAGRALDLLVGGWQTSGIVFLGSGLPFSVTFDSSVQGWPSSRADIVGNPHVSHPTLSQWFNPAAFAVPQPYTFGNSAPNSLFGPHFAQWDTAIFKQFSLTERFKLTFRGDAINALNHANFG